MAGAKAEASKGDPGPTEEKGEAGRGTLAPGDDQCPDSPGVTAAGRAGTMLTVWERPWARAGWLWST